MPHGELPAHVGFPMLAHAQTNLWYFGHVKMVEKQHKEEERTMVLTSLLSNGHFNVCKSIALLCDLHDSCYTIENCEAQRLQ